VNVFDLDRALVSDYERFARSLTLIRAAEIRAQVEKSYASDCFWSGPLISINPHFEKGASVDQLTAEGTLRGDTARVFRVDGRASGLTVLRSRRSRKPSGGRASPLRRGRGLASKERAERLMPT
jgi:hypothetical protein